MGEVLNLARRSREKQPKWRWLDAIKADPNLHNHSHVSARFLTDLAELLSTFTSFCSDGVWAGRHNLARRLSASPRQASRGVAALARMGYLDVTRRGRTTNLMTPMLNRVRLFPIAGDGSRLQPSAGSSGPGGPLGVHLTYLS